MDNRKLLRFVELNDAIRRHEREAEELAAELAKLEQYLLDQFQQNGIDSFTADGYTVYLYRQIWAKLREGTTMPQAVAALKEQGMADMVKEAFNSSTLSAWVREQDRGPDGLPQLVPPLAAVLDVSERASVRARKAK